MDQHLKLSNSKTIHHTYISPSMHIKWNTKLSICIHSMKENIQYMYDIRYLVTQKPSKEKVKLGWGWHPQIFTIAVLKCIQWRLQCLIMKHDLPCERSALLKAYKIVRSYHVKGFKYSTNSVSSKRTLTYNKVQAPY